MIEDSILTKKKFAMLVEENVSKYNLTYMDAILKVCDDRELDPADISKLVSPVIKDKLEAECIELRLIEGTTNQLPV
jgi:hypothetical protein